MIFILAEPTEEQSRIENKTYDSRNEISDVRNALEEHSSIMDSGNSLLKRLSDIFTKYVLPNMTWSGQLTAKFLQ